jgi:hypothetical protein
MRGIIIEHDLDVFSDSHCSFGGKQLIDSPSSLPFTLQRIAQYFLEWSMLNSKDVRVDFGVNISFPTKDDKPRTSFLEKDVVNSMDLLLVENVGYSTTFYPHSLGDYDCSYRKYYKKYYWLYQNINIF